MGKWETGRKPAAPVPAAAYDLEEPEEAYFSAPVALEPASLSLSAGSSKNAKPSNSFARSREGHERVSLRQEKNDLAQGRGGGAGSPRIQQPRTIRSFEESGPSIASTAATASRPTSTAIQMMHQYDTKNTASSGRYPAVGDSMQQHLRASSTSRDNDDEDLLAQKMPAGRAQMLAAQQRQTSTPSAVDRHTRNSTARDDEDLAAQKMPRYRPAGFDPTADRQNGAAYKDPRPSSRNNGTDKKSHHHHHQPSGAGYHNPEPKPKQKAVVAQDARVVEDTDEPLLWDPARPSSSVVPIAHIAEPTSLGQMRDPSTAGEISSNHILPVGKDTVSSYHTNPPPVDQDAPTRVAEASILSYGPIYSSYGSSVVVEASPVNARTAAAAAAAPAHSQYEKGYSNALQKRQDAQRKADEAREKERLTLEKDLRQQQKHQVDRREQQARQVSKIREAEEDETEDPTEYSEGVTTVQHRNQRPARALSSNPKSLASVREVRKDPMLVAPSQKKMCCLGALFGA
eukprot:scaffold376_cov156-Amphora_coffeaeformis.AAC.10